MVIKMVKEMVMMMKIDFQASKFRVPPPSPFPR
jgi:hypothetical protein